MIPGLENAEFVRYGVMHRNTFINSTKVLTQALNLKRDKNIYFCICNLYVMKSILLKLDDELFEEVNASAKELNTTKTGFIKKAILAFKKANYEKRIEAQLKRESFMVREDSMEINSMFDSTLNDGLNND
jgi:predicted transcriptional regulator